MNRSINKAGLEIIKKWESLRLKAYPDTGGVWTIGYGHTHDVKEGDTCSVTQAEQWLGEDIASAENAVDHIIHAKLNDNQYSALVSFAYNVGFVRFSKSTLSRLLNVGRYDLVPAQLKRWVFDDGKKVDGLVNRRNAEIELWKAPVSQEIA